MSALFDPEEIFSFNEEWTKLEKEWGEPVDLETEDESPSKIRPVFSSLDLLRTTFDSSFVFKKIRRKVGRQISKTSEIIDYKKFLQDLDQEASQPQKQFYFVNGQIFSAMSVDAICNKIDNVFQSIDKLSAATSTIRLKKKLPDTVNCSFSTEGLSFDDTKEEKEKSDGDDLDAFIDEAFQQLSVTMATLSEADDEVSKESVTALVKRFTNILKSPMVYKSPRRKKMCCDRFRELAEFWNNRAYDCV